MSKRVELFHIVFGTKYRRKVLIKERRRELYRYLYILLENMGCKVLRINGMEDHVHIFIDRNPRILSEDLMRELKGNSSRWIRGNKVFPMFEGWCREYFAVSKGTEQKEQIINYIKNQEQHHRQEDYVSEMKRLYEEEHLVWYDDDLM